MTRSRAELSDWKETRIGELCCSLQSTTLAWCLVSDGLEVLRLFLHIFSRPEVNVPGFNQFFLQLQIGSGSLDLQRFFRVS